MPKSTVTQYSVPLPNEPGALAQLTKALANANANVVAIASECVSVVGVVHFVTEKDDSVRQTLEKAGYKVYAKPAYWVELANRPGELSRLAKTLADQGVNIQNVYATARPGWDSGYIAVVVDQPQKAEPVLAKWSATNKTAGKVAVN